MVENKEYIGCYTVDCMFNNGSDYSKCCVKNPMRMEIDSFGLSWQGLICWWEYLVV